MTGHSVMQVQSSMHEVLEYLHWRVVAQGAREVLGNNL